MRGGALDWFRSYLTQPEKFVSINDISSGHRVIEYGVHRGSILGTMLFLIVNTDFQNCSNFFNFTVFADDRTLTCKFKNTFPDEISNLQSTTLKVVFHWINVNKLKVNTSKCKIIRFSYSNKLSLPPISIDSSYTIETVTVSL